MNWIDGAPLWRALARARGSEGDRARALACARGSEGDRASVRPWLLGIARTWTQHLARMHDAGWAHADIQPANTLVTRDGRAAVIDYALACGPHNGRCVPYRGVLTHTTAPEIATVIPATPVDTHIQAQPTADIWSLGASLLWCWTGYRPVDYDETSDGRRSCAPSQRGSTTAIIDVRPWPFPAFEEPVTARRVGPPARTRAG